MASRNAGASATNTPRSNQTASKNAHFTRRLTVTLQLTEAQLDVLMADLEATLTTDMVYCEQDGLRRSHDLVQRALNVDYGERLWDVACAADIYRQLLPHWTGSSSRFCEVRDEDEQCRLRRKYGQMFTAPLGMPDPFARRPWRTFEEACMSAKAREEVAHV